MEDLAEEEPLRMIESVNPEINQQNEEGNPKQLLMDQYEEWMENNKLQSTIQKSQHEDWHPISIPERNQAPGQNRGYYRQESEDTGENILGETNRAARRTMNKRKRVVRKGGSTNVEYKNISKRRRRYFSDLYTTLLDHSWSYCILIFLLSFYISWLAFALAYWLIALIHGDLDQTPEELLHTDHKCFIGNTTCCVKELDGFAASFLFSLETQHTIGYGSRQTTTMCTEAMALMSIQSVIGCIIQAFMVGLVFAKLSGGRRRAKTIIFSQNAVIFERNKKLCLAFRIGDLRDDNFILGTQISAKLMRRRVSGEGEMYQEMTPLAIEPDTSSEPCIFFIWPLQVTHTIDQDSPFYNMTAQDLLKEKFEIIVLIEGTIETTSMNFQARSSYLPSEIMWGHRYEPMMLFRKDHNKFQVNFSAFHTTYEVDTPLCSSSELDQHHVAKEAWLKQNRKTSMMSSATRKSSNALSALSPNSTNDMSSLAPMNGQQNPWKRFNGTDPDRVVTSPLGVASSETNQCYCYSTPEKGRSKSSSDRGDADNCDIKE